MTAESKWGEPPENEAAAPSELVLMPCGATKRRHRDSSASSTPSPVFLSLRFLFWLQAEVAAPWMPFCAFIYPFIRSRTHAVMQHFFSPLLPSAKPCSVSIWRKKVCLGLNEWRMGGVEEICQNTRGSMPDGLRLDFTEFPQEAAPPFLVHIHRCICTKTRIYSSMQLPLIIWLSSVHETCRLGNFR